MRVNIRKAIKKFSTVNFGLRKFWVFPFLVWTLMISVSLLWNLFSLRQNMLNSFKYEAQTIGATALATIMWTAQHERVYVPLTEWIPMEPFFKYLPDREITALDGLRFTQVSHALISRQIAEHALFQGLDHKSIRMTSLQPLNPVNTPNEWERTALKVFEEGQTEKFAIVDKNSGEAFKYMMPLKAKMECLKCHHGFKVGDIMGGVSITEPAAFRLAMIKPQIISMSVTHAGIFVIVAVVILYLLSNLRRQWFNLDQLNGDQRKLIVRLAESENKLKEMAVTDELTGLRNRRGFFLLAEQQIRSVNRQKEKINFIFIDVDGMKLVNDKYGHSEGDKSLTATASILKSTFRESDIIARIGGDEFAAIITSVDETIGCDIVSRLYENLDLHNAAAKNPYKLSFSAGIVPYDPDNPCSIEDMLIRADELMYEKKRDKPHCRITCDTGTS